MSYVFFSYARNDWNPFMERFYRDLVDEIAGRMPVPRDSAAFRDEAAVEPGENWPEAMARALAKCQTFVYMHSPRYFASDYCGKEWAIFTAASGTTSRRATSRRLVPA